MDNLHPRLQAQRPFLRPEYQKMILLDKHLQDYIIANKLDHEEIEIELWLQTLKTHSVFQPESYQESVASYQQSKEKSSQITMKIQKPLLSSIKSLASKKGIPYQTFMQSILHQYATGQLVAKD